MRAILLLLLGLTAVAPPAISAQAWQGGRDLPLVVAAVEARAARDRADGLANWRATATGLVRFASVIEHGQGPIERVIRADELRVEVYGEAPNRSKQEIVAWRDTSFLPNTVVYHRDHLGIVANDFGATIRLGDGDEVRDVPHPLSLAGLAHYEFALGDTITVRRADGTLRVVTLAVRPVDRAAAGTVGTLYLDAERAALVRFRFTFTAASYRDRTVSDITVILENSFIGDDWWLPWRQSIAIRRETPWLDLPLSTMLRADWEIGDYVLGEPHPPGRFGGAAIAGLRRPGGDVSWDAPLSQRVTEEAATTTDRDAVQRLARTQMEGARLGGLPSLRLGGRGISDFLRVNRVQGVTLGVGTRWARGSWSGDAHLGLGLTDERVIGRLAVAHSLGSARVGVTGSRTLQDVGGMPTSSGVLNSLRTVVDGSDLGDWTLVEEIVGHASWTAGTSRLSVAAGWQEGRSVGAAFTALDGSRRPNPALGAPGGGVVRGTVARLEPTGSGWTVSAEAGGLGATGWQRVEAGARGTWAAGHGALSWRLGAGAAFGGVPGWRGFAAGGRGTLPGVGYRAIGGRRIVTGELGWHRPLDLPAPPVGRLNRVPLASRLGPFVALGVAGGEVADTPWQGGGLVETVLGLRADLWGPLLRLEAGVSLRTGRMGLTFDVHPDWWPLL
jgi:hypothetical protein